MAASQPQAQTLPIRDLSWDDLAPKGWDPIEEVHQALQSKQLSMFSEESKPEIRKVLDQAPPNLPLDGVVARIGGYVVPLEGGEHGLTELMLVNYFGASTQSPAPAANQIVHVYLSSPHSGLHTMDMVWVTGKLIVQRTKTFRGISDYRLNAEVVERKADGAASSAR